MPDHGQVESVQRQALLYAGEPLQGLVRPR